MRPLRLLGELCIIAVWIVLWTGISALGVVDDGGEE